ncbi:MAG: GUN4 domain-containing protein [Phormidesmis sp. RL_2_1]|nr:GUN4 domain-containing protein [Phormidesmis sp. RL_2_1]
MSSNTIDFSKSAVNAAQVPLDKVTVDQLVASLSSNSLKKQLTAIHELAALGAYGEDVLIAFVNERMSVQNPHEPSAAHGSAYQYLYQSSAMAAKEFIEAFPDGLVCPQSDQGIDYGELQMLLVRQEYELADKLTTQKLCELAGESAAARKWVYFTEISQIPAIDLQAIDLMWGLYSENKFGWSKQRELWLRLGKNWERLWAQLIWKTDAAWTRYPHEFIWDLSAPVGHLPLSNQLRGVRTMNALLSHPAWDHS